MKIETIEIAGLAGALIAEYSDSRIVMAQRHSEKQWRNNYENL